MDIFSETKRRADILKVCDLLGIKLDRSHTAICPFHKEKTPSFSISPSKQIYKCFGCGKGGDVISLVSEVLDLSPLNSVIYLNDHLGLGIDLHMNRNQSYSERKKYNAMINRYNQRRKQKKVFEEKTNKTFQILCDYLHLLWHWEEDYEPKSPEEEFKDLYIKALHDEDKVQYYIDLFIYGTEEDKKWFLNTNGKVVKEYERILQQ